jgi:exopolysaccharide production protein ExoZ
MHSDLHQNLQAAGPGHITVTDPPMQKSLMSVQVLRALAATAVLIGHTLSNVGQLERHIVGSTTRAFAFPGGFGVDLFFAISGLIMIISSERLYAKPSSRQIFLTRRAIRLVPLYWVVTIAYVPLLLLGHHGFQGNILKALATSLAFIPYPTYGFDGTDVFPLYTLGWTLNYEVFFYCIFAIFIVLPRREATWAVIVFLVLASVFGLLIQPTNTALQFWSQPIILEFGFGLLVGALWLTPTRVNWSICVVILICSILVVAADPLRLTIKIANLSTANDLRRVLGWGLPAAAILLSVTFLEKEVHFKCLAVRMLGFVGECSYSLYLVHPFALLFLMKLWEKFALLEAFGIMSLIFSIFVTSYGIAIITHILFEKPLTRWLHVRLVANDKLGKV